MTMPTEEQWAATDETLAWLCLHTEREEDKTDVMYVMVLLDRAMENHAR